MDRLYRHDLMEQSLDISIVEFAPEYMETFNQKIKTNESTYYFSYTTGERNRTRATALEEVLKEPQKSTEIMLGFDSDLVQNLKLFGSTRKPGNQRKPLTIFDRIGAYAKGVYNPVSIWNKAYMQNNLDYATKPSLNNLFNPNMNNIEAIDYSNKSQQNDSDGVIPRWSQEFPRLRTSYKTKFDTLEAPWGAKSIP